MSELLAFIQLGFRHITDVRAADHIIFLIALSAIYRFRDWREMLWVITAFTIGHSLTLALAVTGALSLPMSLIEFLIPVTIVATGIENLLVRDRAGALWRGRYRPVFAGIFGLVHGAGFANYLDSLFMDHIAVPLFGFNVGIELGQLTVLAALAVALATLDRLITLVGRPRRLTLNTLAPHRLRAIAVSTVVVIVAARWAIERNPW